MKSDYSEVEKAFIAHYASKGVSEKTAKKVFTDWFKAEMDYRNRITESELERAVERVRSKPTRNIEDLLTELGFEVTEH